MRETSIYSAHGRTMNMSGTATSPAWTPQPSSNTCLSQATLTILINWS